MSRRILRRVLYDLFEREADVLTDPGADAEHTIDREIRLELDDGAPLYVSWCSDAVQYCIGVSSKPFFDPGDNVLVDASDHSIWRRLIGSPIDLLHLDTEHQIFEVRGSDTSVYLSPREHGMWTADVVTVSADRPQLDA
jgi:hypothetical protein